MFNPLNLIIVKAVLILINEKILNEKNKFLFQNILYLIDFMIRLKKIILSLTYCRTAFREYKKNL